MEKYWFTQPENSFASFYLFNDETGRFVRIRLELGRPNGGVPKIMVKNKRCVGFSKKEDYITKKSLFEQYGETEIVCNGRVLCQIPTEGHITFDFTPNTQGKPRSTPHHGNKITFSPRWPKGVTTKMMLTIAQKYMGEREGDYDIIKTGKMDEDELSKEISSLAK